MYTWDEQRRSRSPTTVILGGYFLQIKQSLAHVLGCISGFEITFPIKWLYFHKEIKIFMKK